MKLHEPIYAIIDPDTYEILGDGECMSLHSSRPTDEEVERVRTISGCKELRVEECRLVTFNRTRNSRGKSVSEWVSDGDTYIASRCPHCELNNKVRLGNLKDLTAPDVEGFKCWSCGGYAELMDAGETGKPVSEDEVGYCVDGTEVDE